MTRILALLLCLAAVSAQAVPDWIVTGILARESSSYYDDGLVVYVDRNPGRRGERGPWQMKRIAWRDIRRPGERYADLDTNMVYARECFERYIVKMYERAGDWERAVEWYNAGPGGRSRAYLSDVRRLGGAR